MEVSGVVCGLIGERCCLGRSDDWWRGRGLVLLGKIGGSSVDCAPGVSYDRLQQVISKRLKQMFELAVG